VRPDLLQGAEESYPIPTLMPPSAPSTKELPVIEDIGVASTACFFTLSDVDPVNWYIYPQICFPRSNKQFLIRWLFEKYDGLRGFWHPKKKRFLSRYGKEFTLPEEIIASMPSDTFLDGELW